MRLSAAQIDKHLQGGLKPIYLVAGDEPLQLMETIDAIRARARKMGFNQREVFDVARGFDWNSLLESSNMMSLFAEQRILELRMPSGSPGKDGGAALRAYAERPADDAVLIIQSGKIDKRSKNSAWFKALESQGVTIDVWPVKATEIIGWIRDRLAKKGLQADQGAVRLIAQRVEGNMLAAAQEIEKLLLVVEQGELSEEQVQEAVANSARYNVYDLIDSALMGSKAAPRCIRILNGLKGEGVQPVQILSPLVTELRTLTAMAEQIAEGANAQRVLANVWSNRKNLVGKTLQRINAKQCHAMLRHAAEIDRVNKGVERGRDPWLELQQLVLNLSGHKVLAA